MPPAETPRRPFSSSAAADVDHDAAADEQPSVELMEWWLATVEGDDQKIAVAGTFRLNQRLYELEPTHIAKCHAPEILESEDGTILVLSGGLNNLRMLGNGYSDTVCQDFMLGFPRWWQSCNLHDVQNTPSVTNGTPILENHTCDGDIPTNEGFPSKERGHDDIANDVSLAPTMQCTNNAVSEAVDSTPAIDHNKTPVACLKNQGVMVGKVYKRCAKTSGENRHRASNNKPIGRPKKQKISHEKHRSATRSHETRSPVSQVLWSPLTRGKATSLSMSTPEDLKLKRTRSGRVVVPQLNEGCQFIVYGRDRSITGVIGLDSPAMPKGSEFKTYQRKKRRTK